jgi:hypothetical protein
MTKHWYTMSKADDSQGLVADEETGKNIAVSYDAKDALLISRAPQMEKTLRDLLRYLLAGGIATKEDRRFCIHMIDDVLVDIEEEVDHEEEEY